VPAGTAAAWAIAVGCDAFALASGAASHGETVRRVRDARGRVTAVWLAGSKYLPEAQVAKELGSAARVAMIAPDSAARYLSTPLFEA